MALIQMPGLNDIPVDEPVLPAGDYVVNIRSIKTRNTSEASKTPGAPMMQIQIAPQTEEAYGRTIWDSLVVHPNAHQRNLIRLRQLIDATQTPYDEEGNFDYEYMINQTIMATIRIRKDRNNIDENYVVKYFPVI